MVCAYKPRTWVAKVGGTQIITVIVLGRKREEDHDFMISLSYIVILCFKQQNKPKFVVFIAMNLEKKHDIIKF